MNKENCALKLVDEIILDHNEFCRCVEHGVVKDRALSEGYNIIVFWVLTLCDLVRGYQVSEEYTLIFCNEDGCKVNNGLII